MTSAAVDLKTLASDALPLIVKDVGSLSEPALVVAANVLADAGYRAAAAPLAARLRSLNVKSECRLDWGMDTTGATVAILRAIARLGASVRGPIRASLQRDVLIVESAKGGAPVRVRLSDIDKDSDGDGLPDVVERRLRSNPNRHDTDADGISDAEDPTPRGSRRPRDEHDEIALAILDQFFLVGRRWSAPVIIVHDVPLAWDRWPGGTLTLTPRQTRRLEARVGYEGILRIRVVRGLREHLAEIESELRPLRPDERRYTLEMVSGGLSGVGYEIVVGKVAGQWVIKECHPLWLS